MRTALNPRDLSFPSFLPFIVTLVAIMASAAPVASPSDAYDRRVRLRRERGPGVPLRVAELCNDVDALCFLNPLSPLLLLVFSTQLAFWAAQGLGFFEQPLLVAEGQSAADTALPPLLLSDAWSPCNLGHRLPYIIGGQAVSAAALFTAGAVAPTPGSGWGVYLSAAFVRSIGIVAATSALDGLLVDRGVGASPFMGRVQAARATGIVSGQLITNLGGGALADAYGLPALAFFMAALVLPWIATPLALTGVIVEDRVRGKEGGGKLCAARHACLGSMRALGSPPAFATLVLSVSAFAGQTVGNFPLVLFLVGKKGLTLFDNGVLNTVFAASAYPGSLTAAWLLDRTDVRLPTAVAQLTQAVLTAAVIWTPTDFAFAYNAAINVVGGFATGFVIATTNAFVLRLSPKEVSATFVALVTGASNAGGMFGNLLVGQIAQRDDYFAIAFFTGAAILAAGAAVLPFVGAAALPPRHQKAGDAAVEECAVVAASVAVPNPLAVVAAASANVASDVKPERQDPPTVQLPGTIVGEWE